MAYIASAVLGKVSATGVLVSVFEKLYCINKK